MASLDMFRGQSMVQVARLLQLKPFDIARILGESDGLPEVMTFNEALIEQIRGRAGVETWWSEDVPLQIEDDNQSRALVRALAQKILDHEKEYSDSTRADNLFRGLKGADQLLIRRTVNQLIREGLLLSIPTGSGLHVRVDAVQIDTLERIASGSEIPDSIEALWT